jgi:hypothetical protein
MSASTASKLVDLHILNLRQTVGALEFTTLGPGKRVGMDDVRVFMKDVGYSRSNLSIYKDDIVFDLKFSPRRTNPVEIMYASFPAFLFLNTSLAGKLLEPLLEFQNSSLYRNDYAAPDLGTIFYLISSPGSLLSSAG